MMMLSRLATTLLKPWSSSASSSQLAATALQSTSLQQRQHQQPHPSSGGKLLFLFGRLL